MSIATDFVSSIAGILRVLKTPNYGLYIGTNWVSLVGTWMARIATGWLSWELTHSAVWVGVIAFADLFPSVLVGPFAGAAVDRWERMRVCIATQVLAMIQTFVLFGLTASGSMTIWILFWLTIVRGAVIAFDQPARLVLIPALVPRSELGAAVAFNSVVFNMARFIGPAMAGLVIVASGVAAAFLINALSFAVFIAALIHISRTVRMPPTGKHGTLLADLWDGLSYTARHPGIGAVLLILLASSLGGRPISELLPAFAGHLFQSGAAGLATLTSAIGAGALLGGLWLAGRSDTASQIGVILRGTLILAASSVVFAATDWIWLAVPALAVSGFAMATTGIAAQTLIQMAVDSDMRGRVMSLYGILFRGGPAVGAVLMGYASDYLGLRWPVFVGSAIVVGSWAWARLRRDRILAGLVPPEARLPP